MRMAFLPVVIMLAGGLAWGQSAAGAMIPPAPATARTEAPVLALQGQSSGRRALVLQQERALTLKLKQEDQALARLAAQRNATAQASRSEPIPTEWPHAKAELIPTQWKAKVILVGKTPAQPAEEHPGTGLVFTTAPGGRK